MKRHLIIIFVVVVALLIIGLSIFFPRGLKSKFKGPVSVEEPLPDVLISEMEDYVRKTMESNKIPGLAMVFVQGNKVVYHKCFGVRDFESNEPITAQTLFGIGSVTKPVTAVLIASLIDEGVFTWDTKVKEILPNFALASESNTKKITIEHTLCMCTGMPRRMEEISVRYDEMSAEDIIESLKNISMSGSFGNQYDYSSRMVAMGGYISALATGGEYGNLADAYAALVQERIFDPMDMSASTFSIEEAISSGNYATPHYSTLAGVMPISPEIEGIFTPIAPAGAIWSNIEDLSNFLITLVNNGVSPDGNRIISVENLAHLWTPQVRVENNFYYGLGWNIEEINGLTVYFHPGGTVGFASELVVIPELDIGFALLTNQLDQLKPIGRMATYRLLEMLTGSEQIYHQQIQELARTYNWQMLQLKLFTTKKVDPQEIAPFLGRYHNDVLGEIKLVLHEDKTLWIDFGEYESSIRPLILEDSKYIFFESVFIGKTVSLSLTANGSPTVRWSGDESIYSFTRLE